MGWASEASWRPSSATASSTAPESCSPRPSSLPSATTSTGSRCPPCSSRRCRSCRTTFRYCRSHRGGDSVFLFTEDLPGLRRAGSGDWAGLCNTYFWLDRASGIAVAFLTQVLPFFDPGIIDPRAGDRAGYLRGNRRSGLARTGVAGVRPDALDIPTRGDRDRTAVAHRRIVDRILVDPAVAFVEAARSAVSGDDGEPCGLVAVAGDDLLGPLKQGQRGPDAR
jgi:hypothetical protein